MTFIYIFPLAAQTAGLNGLNFLWTLMGGLGVTYAKTNSNFFSNIFYQNIFFSTGNAGPSASMQYI